MTLILSKERRNKPLKFIVFTDLFIEEQRFASITLILSTERGNKTLKFIVFTDLFIEKETG